MSEVTAHRRSLIERLTRGSRWSWVGNDYQAKLPADLADRVMAIESEDRLHSKQGRSTARVRFDTPDGRLTVYLKRHFALPWSDRIAALLFPGARVSPGAGEWRNLELARSIGVLVPAVVAAGEEIGPGVSLRSYLMVAELTDELELNVAIPRWKASLPKTEFERLKRQIVAAMADAAARMHQKRWFHKDLYLCHFFAPVSGRLHARGGVTLIDLHRMRRHGWAAGYYRVKDLAQLLYSTIGVDGVVPRDLGRFWVHYLRKTSLRSPGRWAGWIQAKAARYARHNRT